MIDVRDGRITRPFKGQREYPQSGVQAEAITRLVAEWPLLHRIPAGYTYFGQFLAHELVSGKHPEDRERMVIRSPRLDLESIYGSDPEETLRDCCIPGTGMFRLGRTLDDTGQGGSPRDLPRRNGTALIPEPRNDENFLIAQFHCLLLRFHNRTVAQLRLLPEYARLDGDSLFRKARLHVISTFMHLTVNDFLRRLCSFESGGFDAIFGDASWKARGFINIEPGQALPWEFTAAAFRFGHSMVRENYRINHRMLPSGRPQLRVITLADAFLMTGRQGLRTEWGGARAEQIPESMVVDWKFFFSRPRHIPGTAPAARPAPGAFDHAAFINHAHGIDPNITPAMRNLFAEIPGHQNIVFRNLNKSVEEDLGTGQHVAAELRQRLGSTADSLAIATGIEFSADGLEGSKRALLRDAGFLDATPLWVYLLVESSEQGSSTHLGPLGGLIVCETIRNCIRNQMRSFSREELRDIEAIENRINRFDTMLDLINNVQGDTHA